MDGVGDGIWEGEGIQVELGSEKMTHVTISSIIEEFVVTSVLQVIRSADGGVERGHCVVSEVFGVEW